jgi:hypothetical protein
VSDTLLYCQSEDKPDVAGSEGSFLYAEANFKGLILNGNSTFMISERAGVR